MTEDNGKNYNVKFRFTLDDHLAVDQARAKLTAKTGGRMPSKVKIITIALRRGLQAIINEE